MRTWERAMTIFLEQYADPDTRCLMSASKPDTFVLTMQKVIDDDIGDASDDVRAIAFNFLFYHGVIQDTH